MTEINANMTPEDIAKAAGESIGKDLTIVDRNAEILAARYSLSAKQKAELRTLTIEEQSEVVKQMHQVNQDNEAKAKVGKTGIAAAERANKYDQQANRGAEMWRSVNSNSTYGWK